jgi:phage terminase large subunit-like protein
VTCHATGRYPSWWEGYRFDGPTLGWACGDTAKTARDVLQAALIGPPGDKEAEGTGLIPGDCIIATTPKHGLADAIETVRIRHVSGGISQIQFKSYDQGRVAFQGTAQHWIWPDEECPEDVYLECLTRTMTTRGLMLTTFTPLYGLTPLVLSFLPELAPRPEPSAV